MPRVHEADLLELLKHLGGVKGGKAVKDIINQDLGWSEDPYDDRYPFSLSTLQDWRTLITKLQPNRKQRKALAIVQSYVAFTLYKGRMI